MRQLLYVPLLLLSFSLYAQDQNFWRGKLIMPFYGEPENVYAIVDKAIYRIDDETWTKTAVLPTNTPSTEVRIDHSGRLWLIRGQGPIQTSIDEGATWTDMIKNPATYVSHFRLAGETMFAFASGQIFKSQIGAEDWEAIYTPTGNETPHDITMLDNGDIYISFYESKIMVKKAFESNWIMTELEHDSMLQVGSPDQLASVGNRAILGTYWSKVWYKGAEDEEWSKSTDNIGDCSTCVGVGDGIGVTKIYARNNNEVYALVQDQITTRGWMKSNNGGQSFSLIPFNNNDWIVTKVYQLVVQGNNMYINAGEWGFYLSKDNGATWITVNNDVNNIKPHHASKMMEDLNGKWWVAMTSGHLSPGPGNSGEFSVRSTKALHGNRKTWGYR